MSQRRREFKEKWDADIGSLRVYPNKNDIWISVLSVIFAAAFAYFPFVLDGYRFSFDDIYIILAIVLPVLGLEETFATTRFLLTSDGMYVWRWFAVSFYNWASFSDIYVENDSARGDVLVICFSRGIARKGSNPKKAFYHPFRFFAFEFKGQKSKYTGKLQIGLPLVEKEELVSFIKRNQLNVENIDLQVQSIQKRQFMDRKQFTELLAARGIDPKLVSFDSSTGEGYNIRKNHLRWETFVRDNGCEFDCVGFASESDALQHMLDELTALHAQS